MINPALLLFSKLQFYFKRHSFVPENYNVQIDILKNLTFVLQINPGTNEKNYLFLDATHPWAQYSAGVAVRRYGVNFGRHSLVGGRWSLWYL